MAIACLVGFAVAHLMGREMRPERPSPTKKCPECAELVQEAARKCKHCGAALSVALLIVALLLTLTGQVSAGERIYITARDPDKKIASSAVIVWINDYAMERGRALLRVGQTTEAARYAACVVDEGLKVEYFGFSRNGMRIMVIEGPRVGCDGVVMQLKYHD
jgi:hypothetical protein